MYARMEFSSLTIAQLLDRCKNYPFFPFFPSFNGRPCIVKSVLSEVLSRLVWKKRKRSHFSSRFLVTSTSSSRMINLYPDGMTGHARIPFKRSTTCILVVVCCLASWVSHGVSGVKNITYGVARHLRSIGFPEGSGTGVEYRINHLFFID